MKNVMTLIALILHGALGACAAPPSETKQGFQVCGTDADGFPVWCGGGGGAGGGGGGGGGDTCSRISCHPNLCWSTPDSNDCVHDPSADLACANSGCNGDPLMHDAVCAWNYPATQCGNQCSTYLPDNKPAYEQCMAWCGNDQTSHCVAD